MSLADQINLARASRWPPVWGRTSGHIDETESPEKAWDFWKDIVCNPDGTINVEQLKLELSDFTMLMRYYGSVLEEATCGRISKINTHPSVVVSVFNDYVNEIVGEHVKEALPEGADAAISTLESLGYTYHGGEQWKPPIGKA